jgi:hypothetical protein
METMRKFKVGDEIVRVNTKASWAHIGYTATVLEGHQYLGKDFCVKRIFDHQWELAQEAAKSKWTIYNNTLPWSQLSDKQKGKLLLAAHAGFKIVIDGYISPKPKFKFNDSIYKVVELESVKPEPTMESLFKSDWYDCLANGGNKYEKMIAKGWNKSCK